jgi:hypothetical protein
MVFFFLSKTQLNTQEWFGDIIVIKKNCTLFLQSFKQRTSTDASNSSRITGLAVFGPRRSWLVWREPHTQHDKIIHTPPNLHVSICYRTFCAKPIISTLFAIPKNLCMLIFTFQLHCPIFL